MTPGEFLLRQANGEDPRKLLAEFERDARDQMAAEIFEQLDEDEYSAYGDDE